MKNAFLLFTKNHFLVRAHKSKFRLFDFYLFIFSLYRFLSSLLFAAGFGLLPGFFHVEKFPRKRKRGKNYLPWAIKRWKGKFCSEFFTKILMRFGAYFKFHWVWCRWKGLILPF